MSPTGQKLGADELGGFHHCIQGGADGPGQVASVIRFVEQVLSAGFRHAAGITGGEQNPQTRPEAARRGGQLMAAHAFGHDDVSEQQIDGLA